MAKGDNSLRIAVGAYTDAVAVTPSNTVDLADGPTRALLIGTAGALKVDMVGGTTPTFANVPAGVVQLAVTRVYATGTAATGIVALY